MKKAFIIIVIIICFIKSSTCQQLVSVEYFFDTDPGIGNGIVVSSTPASDSLNALLNISAASLSQGFHQLFIRAKDANNKWSIAEQRSFYVDAGASDTVIPITAAEYFIGNDPGIGNGIPVNTTESLDSVLIHIADTLRGLPLGNYTISVRVKDSLGKWSIAEARKFIVCETYGPESDFELIKDNRRIGLLNRSKYGKTYKWLISDNTTDTAYNYYRIFSVGNYTAKLVAVNNCGKDTSDAKAFSIEGIKGIAPATGGNIGRVTIKIIGAGFVTGTTFSLDKGGNQLPIDSFRIVANDLIISGLNLVNAQTGFYRLTVNIPGFSPFVQNSAFQVVTGIAPVVSVNIVAPSTIRRNTKTLIRVLVTNNGNVDAYGIPVIIDGIPINAGLNLLNDTLHLQGLPEDINEPYKRFVFKDSINGQQMLPLIVPQLAPQETKEIVFEVNVPDPVEVKIKANTYKPLLEYDPNSTSVNKLSAAACKECQKDLMKDLAYNLGKGLLVDVGFRLTPLAKWTECISGGVDLAYNIYNLTTKDHIYTTPSVNKVQAVLSMTDIIGGIFKTGVDCVSAAYGSTPVGFLGNLIYKSYQMYDRVNKAGGGAIINSTFCAAECLKTEYSKTTTISVRTSIDPNIKIGPGSENYSYINTEKELVYTIFFENDSSASLPAQTVLIYDTLDKNKLDVSSFRFVNASIGKRTFSFSGNNNEAIGDIDLRPTVGHISRVNCIIDTVTGIVQWQFQTIDTLTGKETTDPLAGFLPPNIESHIGEGSVTFSLQRKETVTNGDSVRNKAAIYFDANEPIFTDYWVTKFDFIKPVSNVEINHDTVNTERFEVQWVGADNVSGINRYDIYVSENNSPFAPWLLGAMAVKDTFEGVFNRKYKFFSIATDNAGNIEAMKNTGEDSIFVKSIPTIYTFNGNGNYDNPANWVNQLLPPFILPSGSEIIIDPVSNGICTMNKIQQVASGGKFTVKDSKKLLLKTELEIK